MLIGPSSPRQPLTAAAGRGTMMPMGRDLTGRGGPEHAGTDTLAGRRQRVRAIVGAGTGNALEWYDWNIYAFFAPFIAAQFFPPGNSALLATLGVFAVSFLMRPLGSILFGWFADRHGRKLSMLLSVALISSGSLLIGIAPTYTDVGLTASVVLVLARLLQGLAYGGEIIVSYTYVAEVAPVGRRGLWSSAVYVSAILASLVAALLGAALTTMLTRQEMADWGWRVPFLVGGALGIVILFLRRMLSESPLFERVQNERRTAERASLLHGIWQHRTSALRVIGYIAGGAVFFYTWVVAVPAYAIAVKHVPPSSAFWSGVVAFSIMVAVLPLAGALSDRIGRRPVLLVSSVGAAVLSFPLNRMIQGETWQLMLSMSLACVVIAPAASILPAWLAELFPTGIRASGMGLSYSLVVALCGGTAPYLQTWLSTNGHGDAFLGYTVALSLVGTAVVLLTRETKGEPLAS
ncbi:MFS transporter [Streptomyces sp. NPDC000410]|uniref:MFS transporter n=1 Tax=Streptomyces sp. NPDC000410 TaxID=3154254 RepID=UPI0033183204